ncbi:Thiol-disulfide isomerase-like thioredoxin [Paraburkholderia piptadeniae]|uniref:Thiol-disulfide isomerase-like thioredoxin n=1 Tax=Paraburkholderia piptadeniae TaxID=1701573 RepID=A0A1N7S3U4_9BURK|nr:TlpA disulfide reductase family protein [Paraburkholderia piptadeniae]SIT42084.1 Thiol-disulfide isomerase-like thioredoxin [Paraburkholderia piptadeniae]
MKRILAIAAVAVVATVGGAVASHWFLGSHDLAGVANAAPADSGNAVNQLWSANVTNADGKPQSLAGFKGRPVVVNFWASWCGPCVEEMPSLSRLHKEYAKKGVEFVGLGVDSDKNVKAFLQKVPVDYPIFVAGFGGADLARAFGNNAGGLPYTVVIDAKGVVRSTKLGQIKPDELKRTLDAL